MMFCWKGCCAPQPGLHKKSNCSALSVLGVSDDSMGHGSCSMSSACASFANCLLVFECGGEGGAISIVLLLLLCEVYDWSEEAEDDCLRFSPSCLYGRLPCMILPFSSLQRRFRVARCPRPSPPASSSFSLWRAIWRSTQRVNPEWSIENWNGFKTHLVDLYVWNEHYILYMCSFPPCDLDYGGEDVLICWMTFHSQDENMRTFSWSRRLESSRRSEYCLGKTWWWGMMDGKRDNWVLCVLLLDVYICRVYILSSL